MTDTYIIKGRSVDGTVYRDVLYNQWVYDCREATLLTQDAAEEVAQILEAEEATTRSPDNGVYQIQHIQYQANQATATPYDMDDLVEIAHEEALISHYYSNDG